MWCGPSLTTVAWPSHARLCGPAQCTLCCDTHTCQHTYQPHMDTSHLPDNGNCCPLQAWLTLKMLSGGGQRVLKLQASLVQAQLPHLMKYLLLHPRALCDLVPCSYTTVRARAGGLNQRLPTVSHSTDHPVSWVYVT